MNKNLYLDLPVAASLTFERTSEALRISREIVENLDNGALNQLLDCSEGDLDNVFRSIYTETYKTLYDPTNQINLGGIGYMDKLTQGIEDTLRIENINYFLASMFPNFQVNWHHLEWGELIMKYNKLCIVAPRDHGKSFHLSNIYPIWKLYRYKALDDFTIKPRKDLAMSERGFLITNETSLGEDLMEILKDQIESNPMLREKLMPSSKDGGSWAMRKIKCKNGARLQIKSYGTKFRGRHPGWMVVDDFLDESTLYNKDIREKFINYFHSVLMNALLKGGQVVVCGTPFHEDDLYGDLKKKKKGWRVFIYPAVTPEGAVLWSDRYNFDDLLEKRDDQGAIIFSREQLCKPVVSNASIFPYDLIYKAFVGMEKYSLVTNREQFPIRFNRVVTGGDFAISASVGADYSVFMTWGITDDDEMWLIHFWREKGKSYAEQIAMLKYINANFRPDVMVLENNQMQMIFVQEADKAGLPVMPHNTNTNKYDFYKGLPSLALLFERYKIKFPRGDQYSIDVSDIVAAELSSIAYTDTGLQGVGSHDDTAMCTWISSCGLRGLTAGFGFSV